MAGLGRLPLKTLCCLFCCPPWPSRIAAKLAFLPPEPTYTLEPDESNSSLRLRLNESLEYEFSPSEMERIEVFNADTSRGHHISCIYVKCPSTTKKTLLFSHANSCDIGYLATTYLDLSSILNCNVFGYDYSGYGQSGGSASEKNLYADIEAAWNALLTRYAVSPRDVILHGQSIGTVPTVDFASKHEVAGVILISPLMSGMRVLFPTTKRTWFFDSFSSIDKVSKITSPVLVIHGTRDEIIRVSHGVAIYEKCPNAVEPLFLKGAGHNNIEGHEKYLQRLLKFINHELAT